MAETPIACDLTVFTTAQRQRHDQLASRLFASAGEVWELADGYAFRYANDASIWMDAAEFIDLERRCCPFFNFALELEPDQGAVWLRLTGREGVKALLWQEFVHQMPRLVQLANGPITHGNQT